MVSQEEDQRPDVDRFRAAGLPVCATVHASVDPDAVLDVATFADLLEVGEPGWLAAATEEWTRRPELAGTRSPYRSSTPATGPWHDPHRALSVARQLERRSEFAQCWAWIERAAVPQRLHHHVVRTGFEVGADSLRGLPG